MKKQVYKLGLVAFLGLSAMTFAQQDGTVGINTDTPKATLDVKTKTGVAKSLRVENTSGIETVTVLDNGNVGIGVNTPSRKLHISNEGNTFIRLESKGGDATSKVGVDFLNANGGGLYITNNGSGDIGGNAIGGGASGAAIYTTGNVINGFSLGSSIGALKLFAGSVNQERMRVNDDGKVGIGTKTPTERLDVAGYIKSSALSGNGIRNVVADENGKLIVGDAVSSGKTTSNEGLEITKTVKVVPNTTNDGNGLSNEAAEGKNLRNYNGTSVPDYQDSDYMIVLTNPAVNGNLQLPSAAANPGRIIYLINGTAYGLGFSATGTGVEDTYPYNFATLANRSGVAFVSTGKTWYPIGR